MDINKIALKDKLKELITKEMSKEICNKYKVQILNDQLKNLEKGDY